MAAPNGMQPGGGGGGAYGIGAQIVPSAGHHHDMQHVWSLVEELSGMLQQNRERWEELQAGLDGDMSQSRARDRVGADEETNGHEDTETVAQLEHRAIEAERRAEELETAYQEQAQLVTAYENGMLDTAERLRAHIYEQAQATTAMHAHYNALLGAAREETLQAQLTHQAWQASFARVSEGVRLALADRDAGALPYVGRIAALREENRLLRRKVGWEVGSDSEDDDVMKSNA